MTLPTILRRRRGGGMCVCVCTRVCVCPHACACTCCSPAFTSNNHVLDTFKDDVAMVSGLGQFRFRWDAVNVLWFHFFLLLVWRRMVVWDGRLRRRPQLFPKSKTWMTPGTYDPLTHVNKYSQPSTHIAQLQGFVWRFAGNMPEPISKQSDDLFDAFGYLSSLQSTPSVCNVYFFLALMCGVSHNACTPQALDKYDLWKT